MIHRGGPGRVLDRRLLELGSPVRRLLATAVALGVGAAALTILRAVLVGRIVAEAFAGSSLTELAGPLSGLAAIAAGGAVVAWATEVVAHHSASGVISALRRRVVRAAVGPKALLIPHGEYLVAGGRSLDAVEGYMSRFVPGLALAVLVPAAVVAWMFTLDPWSGLIVTVTLPLIPIFAVLIGSATRARVTRRRAALTALGHGVLESLRALPLLRAFGREIDREKTITDLADRHRRETMGVLRIAFLSAMSLELAATISVAVVAVAVGLRVLNADLALQPALTVLVLAPEAYLPLRRVAAEFHGATEGAEAAGRVFDLAGTTAGSGRVASPGPERPPRRAPALELRRVTVAGSDGRGRPILRGASLTAPAGSWTAITGPSGSGKSTLLGVACGILRPDEGEVLADGTDVWSGVDGWRTRIGWVPQSPHLFRGTIADNLRFAEPQATTSQIEHVLELAIAHFAFSLPAGIDTEVGERAAMLSAGERARLALARALIRQPDLLILDEPTAHLDTVSERLVLEMLGGLGGEVTILMAAHRPAAAAAAHRVIELDGGRIRRSAQ